MFCYFSSSTLRPTEIGSQCIVLCAHNVTHTTGTHTHMHTCTEEFFTIQKGAIRTKMHFTTKSISCPLRQLCTDNVDRLNSIYIDICMYVEYILFLYLSICCVCSDTNVPPCAIRIMCNDNVRLGEEFMYENFRRILSQVPRRSFKVFREFFGIFVCVIGK